MDTITMSLNIPNLNKMKICSKCKIPKLLDEFHKCSRNKDGKDSACIECVNEGHQARRAKNRDKYNTQKREYWAQHRENSKANSHRWYEKHKKEILAEWKKERDADPQTHRQQNKKYYINNREKVFRRNNENTKNRLKIDPMFRITKALRGRINAALKGISKSAKTLDLLGCSLDFFKQYLENKFRDGMSWGNYGKFWHLDHVKPCSKFDLMLIDEQKKCFNYANLQPLLVFENLSKYDKYEEEK